MFSFFLELIIKIRPRRRKLFLYESQEKKSVVFFYIIAKIIHMNKPVENLHMFSLSQFPLMFEKTAIAPYMSPETLDCHHGRHLATYIKNLNELIDGTKYADMPLDDIIKTSVTDSNATKIFNNAAQVFNHDFFFHCIKPNGGGDVPNEIVAAFDGANAFFDAFKSASGGVFGSGWSWLVHDGNTLKILTTANADTPIAHGMHPVLSLDVWEHAYYLDYQNRRADFIDAFLLHMVNWDFVRENLDQIIK